MPQSTLIGTVCPACGKGKVVSTGERVTTYTESFATATEKLTCTVCDWKTVIPMAEFRDSGEGAESVIQDILSKCHSCGGKLNFEPLSAQTTRILNVKCDVCGSTYDISFFDDGTRRIAIRELKPIMK